MTPPERAAYLIKEVGLEKAIAHANWVSHDVKKEVTKGYWKEVLEILNEQWMPKHDTHKCGDGHYPGPPFTP